MSSLGGASYSKRGAVARYDGLGVQLSCFFLALLYGVALASLPLEVFKDRANYLIYAQESWAILQTYWTISPLVGLSNEPLWLLLNAGLSTLFSAETVLRLIIGVPAAAIAWVALRHDPRQLFWLIIFLLLPLVIKNHIIQLRQGVATSLFVTGWFLRNRSWRLLCLCATPFIHSSFFVILSLFALWAMVRRLRFAADIRTLLFASGGIVVGLSIGWAASLFGARQADLYAFSSDNISGLGFAFWGAILAIFVYQGRAFLRKYAFEAGAITFYLSGYFLIGLVARIFEGVVLLVLLAGLNLTSWRRAAFLFLIVVFAVVSYAMRWQQPWLGWGLPEFKL